MTNRQEVLNFLKVHKLVSILRGIGKERILDTAEAICNGGIRCLEVTIDHTSEVAAEETYEMIAMLRDTYGEKICVGAGTVLRTEEVERACRAGAQYIISPGTDRSVIEKTLQLGCVSMPGAFTPSEIAEAYQTGADLVKLFPAGLLGCEYVRAVRGPLAHIPLVAVGGITPETCMDFLKAGCTGLGIGGNLARRDLIEAGKWEQIEQIARSFARQL